jgi:aconitase A|tara:strand:- start:343 stop:567 length:225 start_codon:yes stop_codon:yes gene_type:complete
MSNLKNTLTTKRFVIRKSLIGKNTIITFVNKKKETITYNHDEVYERNKERFDNMECFKKYKSYTSSNNIPTFCR